MSCPGPDERLRKRLAPLPDGCRAIDATLDRAEFRARRTGRNVWVTVQIEVGPTGIEAIEASERFERRGVESGCGGAT